MDILYKEYSEHQFKDIDLSDQDQDDPEMKIIIKYVEDVKNGHIHFDDIPHKDREKLADLITKK